MIASAMWIFFSLQHFIGMVVIIFYIFLFSLISHSQQHLFRYSLWYFLAELPSENNCFDIKPIFFSTKCTSFLRSIPIRFQTHISLRMNAIFHEVLFFLVLTIATFVCLKASHRIIVVRVYFYLCLQIINMNERNAFKFGTSKKNREKTTK